MATTQARAAEITMAMAEKTMILIARLLPIKVLQMLQEEDLVQRPRLESESESLQPWQLLLVLSSYIFNGEGLRGHRKYAKTC